MLALKSTDAGHFDKPGLSPARDALADHHARLAAAQAEVDRLRAPVDRLRARIEAGEAHMRAAEAEASAIFVREAEDVRTWAAAGDGEQPKPRTRERQAVETKIAAAAQVLDATLRALVEAERALHKAQRNLAELHRRTDDLVLDVLAEMADGALNGLAKARRNVAAAEAKARGLSNILSTRGRELQSRNAPPETLSALFRAAEQINMRLDKMRPPEPVGREVEAEATRWSETMRRLATDPAARIETE